MSITQEKIRELNTHLEKIQKVVSMTESLEIVDENENVLNVVSSEEVHSKKLLHRSVHLLIFDKEGKLFCCYRDVSFNPGWTAVGAHVLPGQDYATAANTALHEKLGLSCKLTEIGKMRVVGNSENEISETYVGYVNDDDEVKPRDPLWKDGKFLTLEEVEALIAGNKATPHLAMALELYFSTKGRINK